ncbi:type 1 glutamine amidotransferase domain-containing protein [Chloroflexia bacterium SDU3-3]|nr:type 1 glutamine amidotransferase domain-containing protein [Chloroflexia bacterium SDU3-3]
MAKRILMVVTSHDIIPATNTPTGLWFEEFATPYNILREAGVAITTASPRGGVVPIDPNSLPVPDDAQDAYAALQQTLPLAEVSAAGFDAIFLPGGHGTMFDLPESGALHQLLRAFAEGDKVIAAVCHGPAGLVGATLSDGTPLVAGKTITAFTNDEEEAAQHTNDMPFLLESRLRELGAVFVPQPNWSDHIEQDGKLITGQNPQSSASIARAVADALAAVAA